jgi:hypothetical protein
LESQERTRINAEDARQAGDSLDKENQRLSVELRRQNRNVRYRVHEILLDPFRHFLDCSQGLRSCDGALFKNSRKGLPDIT